MALKQAKGQNMKKIMILGAGMLQAFVIKKAHDMGYYTIAVDMDENAVGFPFADEKLIINIVDEKGCLDAAKEAEIDGVMTAATDYGVLAASHISQEMGLFGNPYTSAKTVKNKHSVHRAVSKVSSDGNFQFFEITSLDELYKIEKEIVFPVMVKPCDGSGSKGAGRADNFDALTERCKDALSQSLSKRVLLESFVTGQEYGVESFVYDGQVHILAVMKKYMTSPPYYAELGHSFPSGLPQEIEDKIKALATKTINAIGLTNGSVNMDLLLTDDGTPYVVDVGARMGGNLIGSHIVPMGTGIDYIGNMVKAHVGDSVDFTPTKRQIISTALLALTPGKIKELPNFDALRQRKGILDIVFNKQIGDTIRQYKNNLDGCGYVVATADTEEEAHRLAFSLRDEIDSLITRE